MARIGEQAPGWLKPVAAAALLWNLLGLAAVVADRMGSGGTLTQAQAAYVAATPEWANIASLVAVIAGTLGSIALMRRSARAMILFMASLLGVIGQQAWMFGIGDAVALFGQAVAWMQGMVLAIAVALVWLARKGRAEKWLR